MAPPPESLSALKEVLTPRLLEGVRELWFQHLDQEEGIIVPRGEDAIRWFRRDAEFDNLCVSRFRHVLEAVRAANPTAEEVLAMSNTASSLDWLGLILLLDQIPRNCYRDSESAVVFNVFDPLVLEIAHTAIDAGLPKYHPHLRYRLGYRFWFYLPLTHSEDPKVHEVCVREQETMARDIRSILQSDTNAPDDDQNTRICREVLMRRREEAEQFVAQSLDFQRRHQDIILQFGRYPHRNEALGRTPTAEEVRYLEDGGETFA